MPEIEVKILEIDPAQITQRLESLQASISFDGIMEAVFYDYPDGRIRNSGDTLRLRREAQENVLTYKKHISRDGAKIMDELETKVEKPEAMKAIINALGLAPIKQTRKHRIQYDIGDTHVVLDDYKDELAHIPIFIEIEAPNIERLYEVVKLLGYTARDCRSWSTKELVIHYGGV